MNTDKIQIDTLKKMLSGKEFDVVHGKLKDGRIAVGNQHVLVFIPEDKVKLKLRGEGFTRLAEIADETRIDAEYETAKLMYNFDKTIKRKKVNVTKYQTDSGKITYVNSDLMKYFDRNVQVMLKSRKDFLWIYDASEGDYVGIVFTLNIEEERDE